MASLWGHKDRIDSLRSSLDDSIPVIKSFSSWARTLFYALIAERCMPPLHAAGMIGSIDLSKEVIALEKLYGYLSGEGRRDDLAFVEAVETDHWIWGYSIGRQAVHAMSAIEAALSSAISPSQRNCSDLVFSYWESLLCVQEEVAVDLDVETALAGLIASADSYASLLARVNDLVSTGRHDFRRIRAWNPSQQVPVYLGQEFISIEGDFSTR